MNGIVAIIVTYNRSLLLMECIKALKQHSPMVDLLVVNNASTDDTELVLQPFVDNKEIIYYNTGQNLGGAGGYNFGLKKAYELGYENLWLMDDDTIVQKDTLNELIIAKNKLKNNYGFLSSLALWTDGTVCKMNYHTVDDSWNDSKLLIQEGLVKVNTATFVSFLIHRDIITKVGYPIAEYFIWGDDTEYSQRISCKYGIPSYLVANSKVIHKMNSNKGTDKLIEMEDKNRIERMYFSIRNNICTFRRLSFLQFFKYIIFMIFIFVEVLFRKNKYKLKKMSVIIRAVIVGIFFAPKIEYVNSDSKNTYV